MITNIVSKLSCSTVDFVGEVSDLGIDGSRMSCGNWLDESVVEFSGSKESWEVEVEKEDRLEKPIDWEDRDDLNREELENGEDGEDNPVSQPLGIVFLVARFDSFDAHVRWVHESHEVTNKLSRMSEDEIESLKTNDSEDKVKTFHTSFLLDCGQNIGYSARLVELFVDIV